MGRLDDIADRNKRTMKGDSLLIEVVHKIGGDDGPAKPAEPFTLPSQRKSGTAVWKVLVAMLLFGTLLGIRECQQMKRLEADEQRRINGAR